MKRIIIICEGPTEQSFCNTVLRPHFFSKGYILQTPLIKHTHGGIVKWSILKRQVLLHLKEGNAIVTTLIDYYGLYSKHEFPNWDKANQIPDKNARLDYIESSLKSDIDDKYRHRFIPYLQLHEFEGLLFNNINVFQEQIPQSDLVGLDELNEVFRTFDNPEMINNNPETSPSHRLMRIIRGYNKVIYGDILAEAIGLPNMREKCPRFNKWVTVLEMI